MTQLTPHARITTGSAENQPPGVDMAARARVCVCVTRVWQLLRHSAARRGGRRGARGMIACVGTAGGESRKSVSARQMASMDDEQLAKLSDQMASTGMPAGMPKLTPDMAKQARGSRI